MNVLLFSLIHTGLQPGVQQDLRLKTVSTVSNCAKARKPLKRLQDLVAASSPG
jgi:hypothetical protein